MPNIPLILCSSSSTSVIVHSKFTHNRKKSSSLFRIKPRKLTHTLYYIRFFFRRIFAMEIPRTSAAVDPQKHVYSVWALPPEDVVARLKTLMSGIRSEFGGPQFEPHITVVGAISLTETDALGKFGSACEGLKAYEATVDRVATGSFFYQCIFLLIHPTAEVVETSAHCCSHFGYQGFTAAYMPHLSLLYQDLTDDEKKKAQERAQALDSSINTLSFPVTRLALYKTDTDDKTLKSWEKIAVFDLNNSSTT